MEALLGHRYFKDTLAGREVVFVFIEQDASRAAALRKELEAIARPKWVEAEVLEGDFTDHMSELLDLLEKSGQVLAPSFVFIDPFGFKGLPLRLVARILRNPKCECLISFMYESINRFIGHPDASIQVLLDDLFGTDRWREIVEIADPAVRKEQLVRLYSEQLRVVAGLRYIRLFEMINEGNRTEYFLVFGTNSDRGLSKMKEAMWRADPVAGEVFSDRSDSHQLVLFKAQPDTDILRRQLQERFVGAGFVPIEEVCRFVLAETAFSETMHMRRATLAPMERSGSITVRRPEGKRSRPGEYPPGTLIRFSVASKG